MLKNFGTQIPILPFNQPNLMLHNTFFLQADISITDTVCYCRHMIQSMARQQISLHSTFISMDNLVQLITKATKWFMDITIKANPDSWTVIGHNGPNNWSYHWSWTSWSKYEAIIVPTISLRGRKHLLMWGASYEIRWGSS